VIYHSAFAISYFRYQSKAVNTASLSLHGSAYRDALQAAGLGINEDLAALAQSQAAEAAASSGDRTQEAGAAAAPIPFVSHPNLFQGDLQSVKEALAHHQELLDARAEEEQRNRHTRSYGQKTPLSRRSAASSSSFAAASAKSSARRAPAPMRSILDAGSAAASSSGVGADATTAAAQPGIETKEGGEPDEELLAFEDELSRVMVRIISFFHSCCSFSSKKLFLFRIKLLMKRIARCCKSWKQNTDYREKRKRKRSSLVHFSFLSLHSLLLMFFPFCSLVFFAWGMGK
jgi:hypothetical protein